MSLPCYSKESDDCNSKGTSSAEATYVKGEYDVGALVVTSKYKGGDSWVLYWGYSSHITSNSSFFATYRKVDRIKVTMGNEADCPIVGVGDVRIIMFDGVVRTFPKVLHVPCMNRNLIFLGNSDKESFRCISEAGVMKVGRGPKLFMKESIDDDVLYKLVVQPSLVWFVMPLL